MKEIENLIAGYRIFHQRYFVEDKMVYRKLASQGQVPKAIMIACSDSRVDPSIITSSDPGEIFVVRNVANLVPPYQPDDSHHGTSAALEFAINNLKVRHAIVFGHSQCGGIKAMIEDNPANGTQQSFIRSWMRIAADVKEDIEHNHNHLSDDEKARMCEKKGVEKSLENLLTFPWIKDKVEAKELSLHGWYFHLDEGMLWNFNSAKKTWVKVV